MRREVEVGQAIFDLPVRKWFKPDSVLDFGVRHFDRRAATPVGPAAGPHTQLAQNIVLSWLAGGRIIELKTVQIQDQLDIPRPCIHAPNVCFNVEWSQELRIGQSVREYAKAAFLIAILRDTRAFGALEGAREADFDTVFDISVGYDLDGIRSAKVSGFLDALANPTALFDELGDQLTEDLAEYRDVSLPNPISDCVTLSTFHGCPAEQIEAIARYLIEDRRLHTIIKLNPTLLGFDAVQHILHDQLRYSHLGLRREAFDKDLKYPDALAILRGLREVAERRGSTIGAKFTNTLVVANDAGLFPTQTDPYMYLSGQPLHVIAMNLMQRFREDVGFDFPVSFSGGIDARNFASAVACALVPVTVCTDLLRQGGYGRLPVYLRALAKEMQRCGVTTRDAYVLAAGKNGAVASEEALASSAGPEAVEAAVRDRIVSEADKRPQNLPRLLVDLATAAGVDPDTVVLRATRVAGRLNAREIVPSLVRDPRYSSEANAKTPRRLDDKLALYDCINCDLCIPACPNDAIFAYEAEPTDVPTETLEAVGDSVRRNVGRGFFIGERHQLAVVEELCNECSNCEVFCPEEGAPFEVKERIFFSGAAFCGGRQLDGFWLDGGVLHARLSGEEIRAEIDETRGRAVLFGAEYRIGVTWPQLEVISADLSVPGSKMDTAILWRLRTVWNGIYKSPTPNMMTAGWQV